MASFNKVILLGNITRDPQLTYLPSQTPVVEFGIAVNRKWKGQDGSSREETTFVDCQMFGRRGEVINKYLHKGDPIFIEGRLRYESWQSQDGSKRSRTRVLIENFEFVGGGKRSGGQGPGQSGGDQHDYSQQQDSYPDVDDEIPF